MKKNLFLIFLLISANYFSFMLDPLNYITKTNLGLQVQFYNNAGKISIYNPFVYRIVSYDTFTNTMRFPEIVKGLAYIESGFNIHALSNVGAMGIAQFKADAALDYGINNAWNPKQALLGADRMIRYYYQKYNDIYSVLAIYNIGEGNYKKGKYLDEGKNYANKVISASRKISRNVYLKDKYVLYLQAGLDSTNTTFFEIGSIFDYLGLLYFDLSTKFSIEETGYPIEFGAKSFFRLDHFSSIVFGYNLRYNNNISVGPIIGYSYFEPVGPNYEICYDFSKGFDMKNFQFDVGYGNKYWRISLGYDTDFENFYLRFLY
ncbi:lytic transglycosylase [Thermosipho melanesiensis]|uniref:Lytic transglycosylase, catalytic n=2 Tax=Thermosipho melanesiensis TaxID=46541 RepID=A6LK91_THEM4|nr:lytic transglycosylase domain-containing protein [Thermosipho melanesiensis]ABR30342.1 Lytic transglycosylase, catalytic [Thermosipho melanesiensis BI429]APT73508.1 lytic transglycosylase [Thermosipho melanesiensis]OOC37458.1 lytic transglycosylase [Thermosipho melanesiensis]OOC39663.1 lytic transglycosylase [Thermosipho melanesiensis]OOC39692.1 lytic transglycosylase [Thermosipho melanesiensis]